MAKSIYEVLNTMTTETSVPELGKTIEHSLPASILPTDIQFESDLLTWSENLGITQAVLQKGVQKFLIDIRAAFKSSKKTEIWSEKLGQTNVDAMEWSVTNRPNQSGAKSVDKARFADCFAMIAKLTSAGMDKETIEEMTSSIYGDEVVQAIIDTVTE